MTSPSCPHENFRANVAVNRLEDTKAFSADVTIQCADCNERFVFVGLPGGSHPNVATSSVFGHEARLPIRPASEAHREANARLRELAANPPNGASALAENEKLRGALENIRKLGSSIPLGMSEKDFYWHSVLAARSYADAALGSDS